MKVYNVYKANEELYMTFQSKAEAEDFIEYGAAGVFSEEGFYMTEELV